MMRAMKRGAWPIVCAVLLIGCKATTDFDYPADLTSANYIQRTLAAQEFARRMDEADASDGFVLLMDERIELRALGHATLRDLSAGEDFGYRPDLEDGDRWRVTRRWRFWWEHALRGQPVRGPGRG